MKISELIRRRIRAAGDRVDLTADVNAAVAANVDEPRGSVTHKSTRSSRRVVQHQGRTVVDEERDER